MPTPTPDNFQLPPELELDRLITLQEAEIVSTLSPDSWKRHHAEKIVVLSPRRLGVRLRDALMLRGVPATKKAAAGAGAGTTDVERKGAAAEERLRARRRQQLLKELRELEDPLPPKPP